MLASAYKYWVDAVQRGILMLDVLRLRGNVHKEHMAQSARMFCILPAQS